MDFVGRERELRELRSLLDAAAGGRGALAMLGGEPGIGKTRLADAVTAEAALRGYRVAWGRAWESGGAPAYFPWTQVFEALGRRLPDASAATAVEPESARFQLFRGVVDALRHEAAAAPLLLVLDDLHVTDVSSLELLLFVARELRALRVVVLGTRRDVEARLAPDAESVLARIAREGRTLDLRRLERAEVAGLVRSAGPSIPPDMEPAIWEATHGNPLFVDEVVRLLETDRSVARTGKVPIPFSVREVIRQRLSLLDEPALALLDVAAVIGIELDVATLGGASGEPAARVAPAVAAARRAGVLVEVDGGRLRFGHALMRDALYNDLPRGRRAELHAKVADALAQRLPGAPPLAEIAHHAIEAWTGGQDGLVALGALVDRTLRAARALSDAFAHEDEIHLLERATSAVDPAQAGSGRAADLWLALGGARLRVGDQRGGSACCLRIAESARAANDGVLFARAALMSGSQFTIGQTDPMLRALLEEGLARLPAGAGHDGLRAQMQARLAASLQPGPDPEAVAQMALEAVRAARALGDDETLLDVLHAANAAFSDSVASPERLPMMTEAVRLAVRLGDRAKLLRAYQRLIFELTEHGDVSAADAYIEAYEAAARVTGQPRHIWVVPLFHAMRAIQEGRFADADVLAEEAREIASAAPDPYVRTALVLHRHARLWAQHRGADLLALEPQVLEICAVWNSSEIYAHLFRAIARAAHGEKEAARAHFAKIPVDSGPARILVAASIMSAGMVRADDDSHAAELYARFLPVSQQWFVFGLGGFAVEGTYASMLGGFATMLGRFEVAERHFGDALRHAEATRARPEIARVLAAHAGLLVKRGAPGDADRAREMFARARPLAEELGLEGLLASLPAPSPADSAPSPAPVATALPSAGLTLVRDGETWAIGAGSVSFRLKNSRGLQYLARLVEEPGREIHVLDLAGAEPDADAGDAGEMLDGEARAAYKRRLSELDEDVRDADAANDGARARRARAEIEFLAAELSRALGIGGRARRSGSATERARVAVTRRIRDALRRISEQSPALGKQLERSVKTGAFCSYDPG